MITGRPWTEEEDTLLREHYTKRGPGYLVTILHGRTYSSIPKRAERLGLRRYFRWTPEIDAHLRCLWDVHDIARIAEIIGVSQRGVYEHARYLGLKMGPPPGCEYLWHASKRAGYHSVQFRRILAWARVPLYKPKCRPCGKKWAHNCVDSTRVNLAIQAWMARMDEFECVRAAANRRSVSVNKLWRWLIDARRAGLKIPRRPGSGKPWLIPSAVVDEVLSGNWRKAA